MEKIKNALKSINKFGLLALVFVAFATLAFTPVKKLDDVKWRQVGSTWQIVPEEQNYACNGEVGTCTMLYPAGQNPNLNPTNPSDEEYGTFVIIPPGK